MASFKLASDHMLKNEGGFSNNLLDRGGPTKYGITAFTLAEYRGHVVDVEEMKKLEMGEALEIYRKKYWNVICGDNIKSQTMATILFDQAVNRGPKAALKTLQKVLNVDCDGVMGVKTMEVLNKAEWYVKFFKATQLAYIDIVKKDPTQLVFISGWIKRTHGYFE